ncbi:MAG: XRE family transcriptional regulator [Actinophytocola sp.]|nr:XRE family transcriptional regulator [Actinophytocola sp.]
MAENWDAVGDAITARLAELQMTQLELAAESGVSPATIREIQYNRLARRRSPRTLESLSTALKWPASYLADILGGQGSRPHADEANDPVLRELSVVHDELQSLRDRVERIERRLESESEQP